MVRNVDADARAGSGSDLAAAPRDRTAQAKPEEDDDAGHHDDGDERARRPTGLIC